MKKLSPNATQFWLWILGWNSNRVYETAENSTKKQIKFTCNLLRVGNSESEIRNEFMNHWKFNEKSYLRRRLPVLIHEFWGEIRIEFMEPLKIQRKTNQVHVPIAQSQKVKSEMSL